MSGWRQSGVVLVMTLLFLFIFTLLGISIFNTGALNFKMSGHFERKAVVLEVAENALREGERAADTSSESPFCHSEMVSCQWKQVSVDDCGVVYYQVMVEVHDGSAASQLQSLYASLRLADLECLSQHPVQKGRQWWQEL